MCSVWQKTYVEVEPEPEPKSIDIVIGESDTNPDYSLADSSNEGSQKVQLMPVIKVTPDTSMDSTDTYSLGSTDINQSTCDIFFETSSIIGISPARKRSIEAVPPLVHSKWKCFCCGKPQQLIARLVSEVQSMPRTKLFFAVCTILFLFLLMCAAMLAYKIVILQARIESNLDWIEPSTQHLTQNSCGLHNGMYHLSQQQHAATVAKLHSVLQANVHTLNNIHSSLNDLQQTNNIKCTTCDPSPSSSSSSQSSLSDVKEIAS
ncbi:hypothetical protein LSAT2_020854 [Lamellibrachia satsuma]|nr:hypothetical protein LSAT2_020854 [Lamellibrachia satsuma]